MSVRNQRRGGKGIGVAPIVKWVTLGLVCVLYGLFFVNLSHQALRSGRQATELESRLKDLKQKNVNAESHIAWLKSRPQLERRLEELGSSLQRIPEQSIVWLTPSRDGQGEVRAASYRSSGVMASPRDP